MAAPEIRGPNGQSVEPKAPPAKTNSATPAQVRQTYSPTSMPSGGIPGTGLPGTYTETPSDLGIGASQQQISTAESAATLAYESAGYTVPTGGGGGSGPNPSPPPGPTPVTTAPAGETEASIGQSAAAIIKSWAQGVGLSALAPWITDQATTLASLGMSASDIASQIESTINEAGPNNDGSLFNAVMPGYNQRMQNGYSNGGGIAAYVAYRDQLSEFANAAGLPAGFMTGEQIGNLWANDVSTNEVSTRINQGYADAMSAPQQVRDFLQSDYGISTGDLAAYYLDPTNTLPMLQQKFNTASVQAGAQISGFDKSLSTAQAQTLAAFLQGGTDSNGMPNQVNASQAAGALSSSLGNGMTSAAGMAQAGFESTAPGFAQGSPAQVTQAQILGGVEGDAKALAALRLATGTRAATSEGGGGFASDQSGVVGVGSGSME